MCQVLSLDLAHRREGQVSWFRNPDGESAGLRGGNTQGLGTAASYQLWKYPRILTTGGLLLSPVINTDCTTCASCVLL